MTPQDAAALVQPRQLHRDIYLSPAVFALEMSRLWAGAWLFVGHDSQVPQPGDYTTMTLAGQPVMMIRREAGDAPGAIAVLLNRCAHKGAPLSTAPAGHADRYLRCPYHGWTYRLDGTLAGLPVKAGYEGSDFERCPALVTKLLSAELNARMAEWGLDPNKYSLAQWSLHGSPNTGLNTAVPLASSKAPAKKPV